MGRLRALLLPFLICASLTARAQVPTPLQANTPIERLLGSGQHTFTVTLEKNTFVQLVVEQRGIDVVVRVSSPEGRSLGEFDSPNGNDGLEYISFVSGASGSYSVTVSQLDSNGTTPGGYQIKIVEMRQATDQEIKAGQFAREKGVALLLELEGVIAQIQSPFTRINAQLLAGQLLWEPEEKRASKYLTDAANGIKELIATIDGSDPDYSQQYGRISELRFEMTRVLAQRDPEAALSFLYSTVPPPNPYSNSREQASQESMMELSIANQFIEKDPQRTVQIVRKSLKSKLSSNLLNTLRMLRRQNPELAAELANEIARKVLEEKLLKNPEAANVVIGLLRSGVRSGREPVATNQNNYVQPKAAALLSDTQYRELLQKALSEALSFTPPPPQTYTSERDTASSLLSGLQQLGSQLDAANPGGATAVEKKLLELSTQRMTVINESQFAIAYKPVDKALETIEKAPKDQREQLYLQLANREASNGDIARARQLVKLVANPYQQRNALANIDQLEINHAIAKGKVDEALTLISAFRTPKERAAQIASIANQVGPGQKRANAINFLEQARALLGPSLQAQDQEHMTALFEIARAFSRYDAKRSFEIVDPLIDQVNEICTAARTLEGFGADNFDNEELNLQNGGSVAQAVMRMSQVLGTLAVTNFERAKADADRLRLPEVRLRAYLDIAQQSINGPVR